MARPPRRASRTGTKLAPDIKTPFGERVRRLRERAGLSQRDLARASGVSAVYLGTIERAEKGASIETIEKLARGLGVEPAELLRFDAPAGSPDPVEKLARKIVGLARGANESKLDRFERVARAFFEAD